MSAFGDERLVHLLRRGNDAAFEVLYDRYQGRVLSYCRHMLGSLEEAEDALQQSFVSAHADIVATDKPIVFKAWIYAIARNRCLTILRARREQPSDDLEPVSLAGLGEEVQQRAELKEIVGDMQELPEDQRTALVLSELGDLSHSQVAEVIGCREAKVKSLVYQARSGLIERREARETPCEEIREQLATLRGGSLRRGPLRRHVKACPGCAEFREEVRRQRQALALVLPVVPTLGLRESALAAVGLGGGSATGGGAATAGFGTAAVAKAGAAKVAIVAVAAGGAAVGGGIAVEQTLLEDSGSRPAVTQPEKASGAAGGAPASEAGAGSGKATGTGAERARSHDAKKGTGDGRGFEPTQGGSNGEAAREFAAGRGKGKQLGLSKTPPGQARPQKAPPGQERAKTPQAGGQQGKSVAPGRPETLPAPGPKPKAEPAPPAVVPPVEAEPAPEVERRTVPTLPPEAGGGKLKG